MQELESVPQNTPDLEKFIKQTVRLAVRAYINKLAAVFGITNIAVIIGIIVYVAETAPQKVMEIVTKNEKSVEDLQRGLGEVRGNVAAFKRDMTNNEEDISNTLARLKESIPGLNEQRNQINDQISHIKQTMQTLLNTSQPDIDKAVNILTLIKKMPAESGFISRIASIEQNIKTIQDEMNDFTSGKTVFDMLSVRRISIKGHQGRELGYLGIAKPKNILAHEESDLTQWMEILTQQEIQEILTPSEYGELSLYDSNGKKRVALKSELPGGSLELLDENEKDSVSVYKTGLSLYDSKGKKRMRLETGTNGTALLALRDAKDHNRVQLYENESGYAGVALTDDNDKSRMTITTDPKDGSVSFVVDGRSVQLSSQAGARP